MELQLRSHITDDKGRIAAVRELLHEAKNLAARYYGLTGKPLGVTGEVAELEAAENLNLVLGPPRQPDYDAFQMSNGKTDRYQIKGRAVDPADRYRGRVPSIEYNRDFEWVLLVLLDRSTYAALEIWKASRADVRDRLEAPGSKARNERNSMAITQFKSIARRVWPEQNPPHASTRAPIVESAQAKEMTREHAIHYARHRCSSASIQESNTRFANINAGKDVWWIDIPKEMITASTLTLLNLLLCDGRSRQPQLHHIQIPISYLKQHIQDFRFRKDKNTIHLELSSAEANLFQDVIGPGRIQFAQFRHCDIIVSNRS